MNSKTLLGIFAVMVAAIALMGFKLLTAGTNSSASGNSNSAISLSTNPSPLTPGEATFMIDVKDKAGNPVDTAKVAFDLNMTTMNMGTQRGDATSMGNGRYSATARLSMRGPWRVSAQVTMPDGSIENKEFVVNVP